MDDKGKSEIENVNDNHMNYNSPNMSSDWRFDGMGLVSRGNTMDSSCSSASFCPPIWDHPSNLPNMALCDFITQNNTSASNPIGIRKGGERKIDMGMFFPQSLSQHPADTDFIERAARFSCFGGGNFGDMMNNFGFLPMEKEVFTGIGLTSKMVQVTKDFSLSAEHESFARFNDEAKQGARKSDNESDDAELSGGGCQEEPSVLEGGDRKPSSTKGLGAKKRKRIFKDPELDQVKEASQPPDEATNDGTKIQEKGNQKAASTSDKPIGKNGKNGSQASNAQKEEYIHIRARRGQATNSHSLAERVRRERISERMKFLQDLVPGCSKVIGKAVMLDEIINYVQSLQRQVEFLSMKLATVNPQLEFNIDGLLTKDILQSRAGPSSTMGFSPDTTMPFPMLHSSQPGLIQTGLTSMANSSEDLQRATNPQSMAMSGGYKDPTPQVPNSWEDELNNVVQMAFNSSAPLDGRDLSGSLSQGHTKVEL